MNTMSPDPKTTSRRPSPTECRALRVWSKVGLRARLLLAFILVSLVPLMILFSAQYWISKRNTLDLIETSLAQVADVQHRRLNQELARLFDQLKLVSSRTQMRISLKTYNQTRDETHREMLNRIIGDALLSLDHYVGIWIRNPQGAPVTQVVDESVDGAGELIPPVFDPDADSLHLNWPREGLPNIWVSGPLMLENETIGSIHLLLNMVDLYAVMMDFPCQESGGETVLLFHNRENRTKVIGQTCPMHQDDNEDFYRLLESPGFYDRLIAGGSADFPSYHHGQIITLRHLDHDFGDVLVHFSSATLADAFWKHLRNLLIMTVFSLMLVVLMGFRLTRMIARPVQSLTQATRALRQGHDQVRINERYWGEFVELTRSFNHAMRMLSRRTEELNREIEARRLSQQKLIDLAYTDPLTGLINRRHFMDALSKLLKDSAPGCYSGALLFLDLDDFKPINDELGHEAGDLVLQIVAGRLRHLLREGDMAARLGGDEFALLLLKNGSEVFDPEGVAQRVEEQLGLPMSIKNQSLKIRCSIGIIRLFSGDDPQDALNRADQAMYLVKNARRKRL